MKFNWTQALQLDIPPMDQDHKTIISMMEELNSLVTENGSHDRIKSSFMKLLDFTKDHFRREENFMESIKFPGLASHKIIHTRLLDQLSEYYSEFSETKKVPEKLLSFLSMWLRAHICGIDMKYADFTKSSAA